MLGLQRMGDAVAHSAQYNNLRMSPLKITCLSHLGMLDVREALYNNLPATCGCVGYYPTCAQARK